MGELKYKVESVLRELKSLLDETIKLEEENTLLNKKIEEMEKRHAKEMAEALKKK